MPARPPTLRKRLDALVHSPVRRLCPLGGGSVCSAYRADLADGDTLFVKTHPDAPEGFFAAEAFGLDLLADALPDDSGIGVPRVLSVEDDLLVLEWIDPGVATSRGAEQLGRALAGLHATPAQLFGTAKAAFIGPLPLPVPDQPCTEPAEWPEFHARYRLQPALREAFDCGGISAEDARDVEEVCAAIAELAGPPQGPAVVHGDLWSGNVHWDSGGRPWLIDPSAQGGHPEADLAMLRLFGMPQLHRALDAYDEASPPAPGREGRVPLHQLHPLLVHAVLFGRGYGAEAGRAARRALDAAA
ncbi:hypothetical protein BIV57_05655 [Mangrovactinospora gilvigrisea]|uniref:Fructosamine kinase n=1 Tax=Mangrovactinospora gilvigrisea TaxID=1428644 RepID=A0A1J7BIJ5_9ACTN|nr:fructosamine kinase family protein [Mangrovactinospora gilvigrisea]OIV38487.1 hypothetical protein BIV57_05655 [Mangrovactinospora gilvigrisea]